jgi:hypothetical protein
MRRCSIAIEPKSAAFEARGLFARIVLGMIAFLSRGPEGVSLA